MENNKRPLILAAIIGVVLLGVFLVTSFSNKGGIKTLNPSDSVSLSKARLASAKNALDGSGVFTQELCENVGKIAKSFDSNAEFMKCTGSKSLYLSTPDTSNKKVLTISDDHYTAKLTTNEDATTLLDYTFLNEKSAGFNSFGGRS